MTSKSNVTPINGSKAAARKAKAAASVAPKDASIHSHAVTPTGENAKAPAAAVSGQTQADAVSAATTVTPAVPGQPEAAQATSSLVSKPSKDDGGSIVDTELFLIPWQCVAVKQVVLVAEYIDGEFEGWWPARLLRGEGDDYVYEWVDHETMGTFTVHHKDIALLYPAHAR